MSLPLLRSAAARGLATGGSALRALRPARTQLRCLAAKAGKGKDKEESEYSPRLHTPAAGGAFAARSHRPGFTGAEPN